MTEEMRNRIMQEFLETKTIKEFQEICKKYDFNTFADVGENIGVDAIKHFNTLGSGPFLDEDGVHRDLIDFMKVKKK